MTTLTTLPPELRIQIYDLVLGQTQPLLLSHTSEPNIWIPPPISRVCSILRQETIHLYSNTHEFIYHLQSPLDQGLVQLERVLVHLERQRVRLGRLRFRHVNRGVLSLSELTAWVVLFLRYRSVLPPPSSVDFCKGPLRHRGFATEVAVALKHLIGFAARINDGILGSGEEGVIEEWVQDELYKMEEGRAVLRCVRFVGDVLRGFREAALVEEGEVIEWTRTREVEKHSITEGDNGDDEEEQVWKEGDETWKLVMEDVAKYE